MTVDARQVDAALAAVGQSQPTQRPMQLTLVYAYGPFTNVQTRRTDDVTKLPITISRAKTVEDDDVIGRSSATFI